MRDKIKESHASESWLRGADRKIVYEAAIKKKKKVTLSDGSEFTMRYRTANSIAWGEYETVYLAPATGGLQRCGWFHINFLLTTRN